MHENCSSIYSNHFLTAQIHYFIWRAVRIAGDMVLTRAAKSRTHPENSALSLIRTMADAALAEGRENAGLSARVQAIAFEPYAVHDDPKGPRGGVRDAARLTEAETGKRALKSIRRSAPHFERTR